MLYLCVGPNTFTRHQYLQNLAESLGLEPKYVQEAVAHLAQEGTDLFGAVQLLVHNHELESESIASWAASPIHHFCFTLGKLVKEKKLVAQAEDLGAKVLPCPDLAEDQLSAWLENYAKEQGLVLTKQQLTDMLRASAEVTEEGESESRQWWAASCLAQLSLVAENGEVSSQDFTALCGGASSGTAMQVLEAVSMQDSKKASLLLHSFLQQPQGEEKTAALQLVSLLLSQLRVWSVVLFAGSQIQNKNQALEITGWKPGRWFYAQKAVKGLRSEQVVESLRRLGEVETELKSSTLPAAPMIVLALQPLLAK